MSFDLDDLVDHPRSRGARAGNHRGAYAIDIDGIAAQTGDGELIQVGGDDDFGVVVAQIIELLAHAAGDGGQIAGVDAHAA